MPLIHLHLPMNWAYSRRLARGVRLGCLDHPDLQLVWTGDTLAELERAVGRERPDGIIAMARDEALETAIAGWGIKAINVSGRRTRHALPRVQPDHQAIGAMAAEHLHQRGFTHCLFVTDPQEAFAVSRQRGFHERLMALGGETTVATRREAEDPVFLRGLPRPVGIALHLDDLATGILAACQEAGLAVPGDAAVIGVNDDDIFCELTRVPLSSVDPASEEVGRRAAHLMAAWIREDRCPPEETLIPPAGVANRVSTDAYTLDDLVVVEALRLMRDEATSGLSLNSLPRRLGVSRRTLEIRFKEALGRTLGSELRRVRQAEARRLLAATDLSIVEIAHRCGFDYANRFSVVFRRLEGCSPVAWRQRARS